MAKQISASDASYDHFVDFDIAGTGLTVHRCTNGPYATSAAMMAEVKRLQGTGHRNVSCRWTQKLTSWAALTAPDAAAPVPADLMATLQSVLATIQGYDKAMDDPNGDGSGDNAQSPTGDDYNEVCGLLQPLYDALGMVGPCSPYSERHPAGEG